MLTKFKVRTLLFSMVLLLFGFFSNTLQAQILQGDAAIIRECLDLEQLQAHFPKNVDNTYQQVRILQFPVEFDWDTALTKFDKPVLFQDRAEIADANPEAQLNFMSYTRDESAASVDFILLYDLHSEKPKLLEAKVQFSRVGNEWQVINSTYKNQ